MNSRIRKKRRRRRKCSRTEHKSYPRLQLTALVLEEILTSATKSRGGLVKRIVQRAEVWLARPMLFPSFFNDLISRYQPLGVSAENSSTLRARMLARNVIAGRIQPIDRIRDCYIRMSLVILPTEQANTFGGGVL